MNRQTIDIELPDSRARVSLYEYLTNGESRSIKRIALSSFRYEVKGGESVQNFPAEVTLDMQDKALSFLIKEIYIGDIKIEDVSSFVNDLTENDGRILYDKVDEITKASTLSPEQKKK